nr:hypothetical protein [uncultured Psychroserpens sp.]
MKKGIKIIGIVLIAYLFIAHVLPTIIEIPFAARNSNLSSYENSKIVRKGATEALDNIITQNLNDESTFNPKIALNSIIELYQKNKNRVIESNEKPIDIYVIYRTDNWIEDSQTFELSVSHQKVDSNTGNLYEYRIDMIYDSNDFKGIDEFDVRYNSNINIEDFKKSVIESVGFKIAMDIQPIKIEIIKEQI